MTDEEKLTLIQKYEDLPEEEFKEECFEDLKKFAFDKDDTVKTFTASVLSRFVNTAKQQEAIEILLQLCREENELIRTEAYDAIGCYCEKSVVKSLEKAVLSEKDGLARSYAIDSWIFGEKNVLNEILNYIKNTDYHIRYSVLAIIQLILEDENYTEECKRKIKITLTELLKREKANAVKEQAEEIMRWL